jgi:hypothetical protein
MTPIEEMTDEQFEKHTLAILERELGPMGTARYLRTHGPGTTDYTRDRHLWLDHLTIDEILEEAKKVENQSSAKNS